MLKQSNRLALCRLRGLYTVTLVNAFGCKYIDESDTYWSQQLEAQEEAGHQPAGYLV